MSAEDLIRAGIQAAVRKPLMDPDPAVFLRLAGLLQTDYKSNFHAVDMKSQHRWWCIPGTDSMPPLLALRADLPEQEHPLPGRNFWFAVLKHLGGRPLN